MNDRPPIRDERTVAVVDTSSRFAYMVLAFGVMIIAVVRGLVFGQVCWDLLGLVWVSSLVATVYQRVKHVQVFSRRQSLLMVLTTMVAGAAAAIALALLLKR